MLNETSLPCIIKLFHCVDAFKGHAALNAPFKAVFPQLVLRCLEL